MSELQRITTQYVDIEDRMRLSGEIAADRVEVLWLTQRLLNRLITLLLSRLEPSTVANASNHIGRTPAATDGQQELMQGFAQRAAVAALTPQPAVQGRADTPGWRVLSVDVIDTGGALRLVFKSGEDGSELPASPVALTLSQQALRQWLGILHDQYLLAEWPMGIWPSWMHSASTPLTAPPAMRVH